VAGALARLERGIASPRGTAALFALALLVYALQSVALPVVPGRDFGTYLRFYVQMFEWDSVLPMSMLYRTPVAPLLVGGWLDLLGGYATQALMAVLYAASIVCWVRVALCFGRRAALLTAIALLLYPGYGILFHMLSSDSVCAFVFAVWGLLLTSAWREPTVPRFALLGVATAAAALTRPGYQVLVVFALLPLVLAIPWRIRLTASLAYVCVVAALLGGWAVNNGLRYDDYALARGSGAFFPFYRAFTTDRIVSPGNGDASLELAEAVRRELLPQEPYRSYGITLERFFENGGPREFEDVVNLTDRTWGWRSDYAQMRDVGLEAVRAEPWTYARGVAGTMLDELWSPLHIALPGETEPAPVPAPELEPAGERAAQPPTPSEGEQIPAARQGFFTTTPDGSVTEAWTSATDHSLVFSSPEAEQRFARLEAATGRLDLLVPPYPGNAWLTLQFSRSSKLFPPPLLWLIVGLVAWLWRRPAQPGIAVCIAAAGLCIVAFQALAIYSIIEFAIPVAPAFVVVGSAGLLGQRRTR
jgi:hypothetical protein